MSVKDEQEIKVIIADDHPLVISGISEILNKEQLFKILESFSNGTKLLQSPLLSQADVLLLDLNMPGKDGLQVLDRISQLQIDIKVVIITSYFSKDLSDKCKDAGASGYILKSENLDKISEYIVEVVSGKPVFPDFSKIQSDVTSEFSYMDEFLTKYNLTKRETEVIQMVCQGYNSQEIADKLYLSSFTVQTHRRNIFKKLNIEGNTIALYRFAASHGLI
ncbi:MAG: hypothetical protein CL526_00050 [Aequorivita sp.]|nr:hypothetical protein [Aequorivita sp.]|tara:strand:+ start:14954 stop:15613 length:660 start_codon:yes stop_codon:yes gene_type:complete